MIKMSKRVYIRVFGDLQQILKWREREIELSGNTLIDVLREISNNAEKDLIKLLTEENRRTGYSWYRVYLNGRDVTEELEDTEVQDGDHVVIFTTIGGG
jgi:molybdopterin converting factor small subunit